MSGGKLRHIAIIMDGNNRWARERGLSGIAGHREGVERIRDVMTACQSLDVEVLTLFAFSSENWRRPSPEVEALMGLFLRYLNKEAKALKKKQVRLQVVGNRSRFSRSLCEAIARAEALTDTPEAAATLVIAADYGGRWEIARAAAQLAEEVTRGERQLQSIDEWAFAEVMPTCHLPPLDLLIRTGNEQRISNFLLWQAAYAELYFSPLLWPDFDGQALQEAAADFYQRQRRFGRTAEQLDQPAALPERGSS